MLSWTEKDLQIINNLTWLLSRRHHLETSKTEIKCLTCCLLVLTFSQCWLCSSSTFIGEASTMRPSVRKTEVQIFWTQSCTLFLWLVLTQKPKISKRTWKNSSTESFQTVVQSKLMPSNTITQTFQSKIQSSPDSKLTRFRSFTITTETFQNSCIMTSWSKRKKSKSKSWYRQEKATKSLSKFKRNWINSKMNFPSWLKTSSLTKPSFTSKLSRPNTNSFDFAKTMP